MEAIEPESSGLTNLVSGRLSFFSKGEQAPADAADVSALPTPNKVRAPCALHCGPLATQRQRLPAGAPRAHAGAHCLCLSRSVSHPALPRLQEGPTSDFVVVQTDPEADAVVIDTEVPSEEDKAHAEFRASLEGMSRAEVRNKIGESLYAAISGLCI